MTPEGMALRNKGPEAIFHSRPRRRRVPRSTSVKRRKICAVTTSRADFGLMRGLLKSIRADSDLRLQVIVSGMHLAQKFGQTWRDIEDEGIQIDRKISM